MIHREKFKVKGPERLSGAFCDLASLGCDPVLGQFAGHQPQRQPGAGHGDVAALPKQVRQGPDVILVRVRQHDRLDLVEPALEVGEVRQDQVDARLIRFREQHAAVHDQQPARVLEDRHVPADLAEPAQRDDPQAVGGEGRRRPEFGVRVAHRSFTPPATRSVRSRSASDGVASASGRRTGPPGRPSMASAALVETVPCIRVMPV